MNLGLACIRNSRTATAILFFVIFAGIWTYWTIPKLENPEFTIRTAVVVTHFPGATPYKVESLVTDKLEQEIRDMEEVKTITSQSMSNVSIIHVEFQDKYSNMDPIWQRLRNKVRDARPALPDGALPPVVNDEFGDVYGILLALTGSEYSPRELETHAETLRDALRQLPQVAKVEIHGVQEERIYIEFSNSRLARLGLSPYQLLTLLEAQNSVQPSGSSRLGPERVILETSGEFQSVVALRRTAIRLPGASESIALEDIATVRRGYADPPASLTRYNGRPALVVAVSMTESGNIVELGDKVDALLAQSERFLPLGLDVHKLMFQSKYVQRSITDFTFNLLEAFVFVVVVMFFFTGLRTGLIAAMLVPLAMLSCIFLLPLFDVKLQQISIAALIISLGILVDNGVVVSENLLVRLRQGQDRLEAVKETVSRLWLPLLVASLTTIFAFLPIPLAQSDTGEYTFSLFVVVSLTLLASWLLSLSFVPLSAYYFLHPQKKEQRFHNRFYQGYRALLNTALRHRLLSVAVVVLLVAAAVWGFRFVPTVFFPPNEREVLTLDFWQPYGTDIRTTAERADALAQWMNNDPAIETVGTFIGSGGPRWYLSLDIKQDNPNYAFFVIKTVDTETTAAAKNRLEEVLQRRFPDTRFSLRRLEYGPPVGAPIQIRLSGQNIERVYTIRDRIVKILHRVPEITTVWDDWGEWAKKIAVEVDQERAKKAGFTSRDIATSLLAQMSGIEATQYREGDEVIPIVLRSQHDIRDNLHRLEDINVYARSGQGSLPLAQLANPELTWQPSNIRRRDTERTMTIKADITDSAFASQILEKLKPELDKVRRSAIFPTDFTLEYGGEFEQSAEANWSILVNIPLAAGLLLLVLMLQFNSLRRVGIIVLTIPPMSVGVTAGLIITQAPFGFMAMLGLISLVGILANNGIMLLDQIELERVRHNDAATALVTACQKRLRPIFMTACTTILGLVPLSLQGGELWRPMANTIIFGLAFSTLLTLVLCPVLYAVFFHIQAPRRSAKEA